MDEQALEALVGEVEQAWNAHDMSRFAACFAEDFLGAEAAERALHPVVEALVRLA